MDTCAYLPTNKIRKSCLLAPMLLFFLNITGCIQPDLDYLVNNQKRLHRLVEKMQSREKRFLDFAHERLENVEKLLTETSSDLNEISRKWKSQRTKIEYEYNALERDLDLIEDQALSYFEGLQMVSETIRTNAFQQMESKSNRAQQQAWSKTEKSLRQHIDQLEKWIKLSAKDYHKVLINTALRQDTQNAQKILKKLRTKLDQLCTLIRKDLTKLEALISWSEPESTPSAKTNLKKSE